MLCVNYISIKKLEVKTNYEEEISINFDRYDDVDYNLYPKYSSTNL